MANPTAGYIPGMFFDASRGITREQFEDDFDLPHGSSSHFGSQRESRQPDTGGGIVEAALARNDVDFDGDDADSDADFDSDSDGDDADFDADFDGDSDNFGQFAGNDGDFDVGCSPWDPRGCIE